MKRLAEAPLSRLQILGCHPPLLLPFISSFELYTNNQRALVGFFGSSQKTTDDSSRPEAKFLLLLLVGTSSWQRAANGARSLKFSVLRFRVVEHMASCLERPSKIPLLVLRLFEAPSSWLQIRGGHPRPPPLLAIDLFAKIVLNYHKKQLLIPQTTSKDLYVPKVLVTTNNTLAVPGEAGPTTL